MNYYRVEFGGLSDWMIASFGYFGESRSKWTQQPDHWSMFYMAYDGVFSLNNRARPFTDGSLIIVAPGMKAGIWPVGDGASHYGFTFGIKKGRDVIAVPSLTDLGDAKELRRRECMESEEWLSRSLWRSIACAYSLLWSVAQPSTILRSSDLMYDFERLVTERLSEKLSVADLADQLDISQSQLLRSVKAEYNQTAQQFIREKRAEIAKTLILTTDLPMKTIAVQTGMPDLQYFNKAIRSISGLSPRALRELSVNRTKH